MNGTTFLKAFNIKPVYCFQISRSFEILQEKHLFRKLAFFNISRTKATYLAEACHLLQNYILQSPPNTQAQICLFRSESQRENQVR